MRINKYLAQSGVASRRQCDAIIAAGRVKINGRLAKTGEDVNEEKDVVSIDGVTVRPVNQYEYYIMNKPKGCVCTVNDDKGRKTVMDLMPEGIGRVFPVGRLDYDTEGLLILTSDGELANRLTHPASNIPKTYLVRIEGTITEQELNRIRAGIEIDTGMTKKCKATIMETHKLYTKIHITITEGKNREIRKMFAAIGKNVDFLKRIRLGDLTLRGLDRGSVRKLTQEEIYYLSNL